MQECRKKGLSYFCEEKWHQGRRCVRPKLYLMEGIDFPCSDNNDAKLEVEQVPEGAEGIIDDSAEIASISIQAMVGTPRRVVGQLKKRRVIILIDIGGTHHFVDTTMAIKCGLMVQKASPMQVRIANGDMVSNEGMCNVVTM